MKIRKKSAGKVFFSFAGWLFVLAVFLVARPIYAGAEANIVCQNNRQCFLSGRDKLFQQEKLAPGKVVKQKIKIENQSDVDLKIDWRLSQIKPESLRQFFYWQVGDSSSLQSIEARKNLLIQTIKIPAQEAKNIVWQIQLARDLDGQWQERAITTFWRLDFNFYHQRRLVGSQQLILPGRLEPRPPIGRNFHNSGQVLGASWLRSPLFEKLSTFFNMISNIGLRPLLIVLLVCLFCWFVGRAVYRRR